ncbi:MAG: exodeoxyribonuclease V subunit gamma [Vallitaleaceae bacterium]|nr:exodeoxyribonuclease V subunit gamma [Vallitaleaceae bacterium]
MSVTYFVGDTGTGKTKHIFEKMLGDTKDKSWFYVVPEQYTLQAQEELLSFSSVKGLLNVEVISINRFVYRFFDELGMADKKMLTESGISLLIRKIIEKHTQEFTWFSKYRKKQSYMEELSSLIQECYQYHLDDQEIKKGAVKTDSQGLTDKLLELSKLLSYFNGYMKDDYMTQQEALRLFVENIDQQSVLKEACVVFDGFNGFTPIQYQLIEALIRYSKEVYFLVTIPLYEKRQTLDPAELFYESKNMLSKLNELTRGLGLEEEYQEFGQDFRHSFPEIAHINRNIFRYPIEGYQKSCDRIRLVEAEGIEQEIHTVALRIHQLLYEAKGYRFKDIVVLTSELGTYEVLLKQVFSAYGLSYFIDKKEEISHHPFIQFILSALLVIRYQFRYEFVFYHLKSIYYPMAVVDQIEEYALRYGCKNKAAYQRRWENLDEEKNQLFSSIFSLEEELKSEKTVTGKTKAIYHFIENSQVFFIHEKIADELENSGELQEAMTYYRVYDLVMDFLDEIHEIIGEEKIQNNEYVNLIETGLSQIKLGQTPPSLDQIIVGDISRTKIKEVKAIFILGANDGKIPKITSSNQLITDQERQKLIQVGLHLAPPSHMNYSKEIMNVYMAISKATHLLHFSYPRKEERLNLFPATMILMIRKMFKQLKIGNAREIVESYRRPIAPYPSFERLVRLASHPYRAEAEEELMNLLAYYFEGKHLGLDPDLFVQGKKYINNPVTLHPIKAEDQISSVSELEQYEICPYYHFLNYRLQLKERDEFIISLPDIGILFHSCLELYMKKCVNMQVNLSSVTAQQRNLWIDECIDTVVLQDKRRIFDTSNQNRYMLKKLTRILRRAIWGIERQLKNSLLQPKELEYRFDGSHHKLEALTISLNDQEQLYLKGTVDRIDEYETDQEIYVCVIDYKSGSKDLDLNLVYHGVMMQLFVYLNVVRELKENTSQKKVLPCGVYYYQIQDPMVRLDEEKSDEEIAEEAVLKQLKPKGLFVQDEERVRMLDTKIEGRSKVYPLQVTSKGISKSTNTIEAEDLELILAYVKKKVSLVGRRIHQGELKILPYRYEEKTACDYCQYQSICRFDLTNGEEFRKIPKMERDVILEKMKGDET